MLNVSWHLIVLREPDLLFECGSLCLFGDVLLQQSRMKFTNTDKMRLSEQTVVRLSACDSYQI